MGSAFPSLPLQENNFANVSRRVDILQRVMALIGSGLELEPLLSKILDSAVTLIQATHGTIGLVVRGNRSSLRMTCVQYILKHGTNLSWQNTQSDMFHNICSKLDTPFCKNRSTKHIIEAIDLDTSRNWRLTWQRLNSRPN